MGMVLVSERKEEGFVHRIAACRVQLRGSVATHLYIRHVPKCTCALLFMMISMLYKSRPRSKTTVMNFVFPSPFLAE